MARTTVSEVVEKIRRQVLSSYRAETDLLDGLMDDEVEQVPLADCTSANLIAGATLSVGQEVMRVRSVDRTEREVTVVRGWGDSDADPHDPGDVCWINPRWTGQDIYDHLIDEIASWPTSLFRVYGDTHSVASETQTLELPVAYEGMYGITAVRQILDDTTSTAWPVAEVKFQRGTTGWDGASTTGLFVRFIRVRCASQVYIEAAMPFDLSAITWESDLVENVGLSESMLDLLAIGVKMRLLVDAETDRSARGVADDPRAAQEVPPGAGLQSAEALRQMYRRRQSDEIARLARLYPMRIT